MEAYAVIQTGGKQYKVQKDDVLKIEKLDAAESGGKISLTEVMAISDGNELKVGSPLVDGASVEAEVIDQVRGKKVVAFKRKRRKGYKRKVGHRQDLTQVRVSDIRLGS